MKVRFLADADLNKAIVSGVLRCQPSIDFLTADAAGTIGVGKSAGVAATVKTLISTGKR